MITKIGKDLIEKSTYAHTTSVGNLKNILGSGGSVLSLRHIARRDPNAEVSVEPLPIPIRQTLPAQQAYNMMRGIKDTDSIFLTRNGYLPNYGDVVITKSLADRTVSRGRGFNTIPEEFTTKRPLSLRHNATVYVPDEHLDNFRAQYPNIRFSPKAEILLRSFGLKDRAAALYGKTLGRLRLVKEAVSEDSEYKRLFGSKARLVGSEALGINVPGSSDIDVFVPYKSQYQFQKALERISDRYPGLLMNAASVNRPDKKTFTGKVNGRDMDVVISVGPRAERFARAFADASEKLTDEQRAEIIRNKERLRNAWFFPETRYKRYKSRLAEELGLKQAYY